MKRREFLKKIIATVLAGGALRSKAATTTEKAEGNKHLNVLFIAVDDMNDWTARLEGYSGKVYTPIIPALPFCPMVILPASMKAVSKAPTKQ